MLLSAKNVEKLCNKSGGLRASIYIPTHPKSSSQAISQDVTRFKNALQQLAADANYNKRELDATLQKLHLLVDEDEFWKNQDVGLAIFADAEGYEFVQLPYEVTEATYLKDRFIVSPLLVILSVGAGFYLLDINFTQPRLFYGNSFDLSEVNNKNMPASEEEESGRDEGFRKSVQRRGGGTGFHGHGEEGAMSEAETRYLRKLAAAVDSFLENDDKPLVLTGTSNRIGNIRPLLAYGNVTEQTIVGSQESLNTTELFEASAEIVTTLKRNYVDNEVSKFLAAPLSEKLVNRDEIMQAITDGRVSKLFVPSYKVTADSVRPGDHTTAVLQLPDELLGFEELAAGVIGQGGELLAVAVDASPELDTIKALTRF